MPYLHPVSQSPDPTYGRSVDALGDHQQTATLYPRTLVRATPERDSTQRWGDSLDLFRPAPEIEWRVESGKHVELFVDFATELDAELVLEIDAPSRMNVLVWRGESIPEAEGLFRSEHPSPLINRHVGGAGKQTLVYPALGFRFVRIEFHDAVGVLRLESISAKATWTFQKRDGDFQCSDARFQRVWQTSAYTARLCTRHETYWDGIKRDRWGWFGDGRIIKEATDQIFFDPRPAEAMLQALPTDKWANGVPNYSFDAIAMLRAHVLRYGLSRDCVRPAYALVRELLKWTRATQCNEDGFIVRTEGQSYAFDTGFVDWSEFPLGGRHEELGWLQATHLAGLRNAIVLARWLGDEEHATSWERQASALAKKIHEVFWRDGIGYIHTLNHVGQSSNSVHPNIAYRDWHTPRTYKEKIRLGESGPSRQVNALAILAGLGDTAQRQAVLERVFNSTSVHPVTTPYFAWYEQRARALCGDRARPLLHFRDYVGNMLETEDAATVWEYYHPQVRDLRRFVSHLDINFDWPTSLCHGWGAGAVPLTTELLLGITPIKPGFTEIDLRPVTEIDWSFQATVPTPFGPISAQRDAGDAFARYRVPAEIDVSKETPVPAKFIDRV